MSVVESRHGISEVKEVDGVFPSLAAVDRGKAEPQLAAGIAFDERRHALDAAPDLRPTSALPAVAGQL